MTSKLDIRKLSHGRPSVLHRRAVHRSAYEPSACRALLLQFGHGCWRAPARNTPQRFPVHVKDTARSVEPALSRLNLAGNAAVKVMLAEDEADAWQLCLELDDMRLELADDPEAAKFVSVLQAMLCHTASPAAATLEPQYLSALNRICTATQASNWKVNEAGKPVDGAAEPKFSTWEEVMKGRGAAGQQQQQQQQQQQGAEARRQSFPTDTSLYQTLGVGAGATREQIKSAFKQLALKWHPDVSIKPGTEERFIEISKAYDVLSDEESRKLYDLYGLDGMQRYQGAEGGAGNSSRLWEEFKPYQRANKSTRARDASRQSYEDTSCSTSSDDADTDGDGAGGEASSSGSSGGSSSSGVAKAGDLVEYPLSEGVKRDLMDGRSHGVGLLVACNSDRGDRKILPAEKLELCEVEPLRQEEAGSTRWVVDELAPFTLSRLSELRVVPVVAFDYRFDVWTIEAELSPGCGGPEIVEEVML